jgi:L-alanine-DL-glutamate epimerase-like enolase superfamily enzyme
MKITAVRPSWLRAEIPADRAHVSDFGRNDSFNTCLVEIETDDGLVGLGEAKIAVGNLFAAGLHLCVATPCATTVEFSRGHNPLLNDLTEEPFELVDGYVRASTRPGLGLTLRRDFVKKITVPV